MKKLLKKMTVIMVLAILISSIIPTNVQASQVDENGKPIRYIYLFLDESAYGVGEAEAIQKEFTNRLLDALEKSSDKNYMYIQVGNDYTFALNEGYMYEIFGHNRQGNLNAYRSLNGQWKSHDDYSNNGSDKLSRVFSHKDLIGKAVRDVIFINSGLFSDQKNFEKIINKIHNETNSRVYSVGIYNNVLPQDLDFAKTTMKKVQNKGYWEISDVNDTATMNAIIQAVFAGGGSPAPIEEKPISNVSNPVVNTSGINLKANASSIRYMAPRSSTIFAPQAPATRYEVIMALNELFDISAPATELSLSDVSSEYRLLVQQFVNAGILSGYPDGSFKGENGITRAELVKILSNMFNISPKVTRRFQDTKDHWAEGYIDAFSSKGYIKGYPEGGFLPDRKVSRAEVVQILNNILGVKPSPNETSYFQDLKDDHWAYGQIMSVVK